MKKLTKWILHKFTHDRLIWFCVIVYPLLFFAEHAFRNSTVFTFLQKNAGICFLILFAVFAAEALCLVMDIWSSFFALKAQGGKLRIKEQDGQNEEKEE